MPTYCNHIAVYGTLRTARRRLGADGCKYIGTTTIPGKLYDLVSFPGLVTITPDAPNYPTVRVDVVELPSKKVAKVDILRSLDQIENFLYNREVISVWVNNAGFQCYIYTARDWVIDGATQIPGNPADWLEWVKSENYEQP